MSDRLEAAVAELVSALRAELVAQATPTGPDRLLDIETARQAIGGVSRTTLYGEIQAGRLRSIKTGRRRLIPQSAITDFITESGGRAGDARSSTA
jgi:excisionase family DNA binding protein